MEHNLDGKVVIITGASSGIGAETARQLSRLGCRLTLAARSEGKLTALEDEIEADVLTIKTDVTARDDIARMVEMTLDRFGRIDVMYANAGIYIPGKWGMRLEDIAAATDDGPRSFNNSNHDLVSV